MNPLKRKANSSDLIVLWETQIKPDLQGQIDALYGGDEGNPQQLTKRQLKELMQAFLDYAGSRVATLAILDARGIVDKNKSPTIEKL